jgi:hypothetical protein
MIVNINARILGNSHIFVQYQEDGKAKDAGFSSWGAFIAWLSLAVK